jgi:hypothetical protein
LFACFRSPPTFNQTCSIGIIRKPSSSSDLPHIAADLTSSLLYLGSAMHLLPERDHFEDLRLRTLMALAVMAPYQSVPLMTNRFYSDNFTVHDRLCVLDVLQQAAWELSFTSPNSSAPTLTAPMRTPNQIWSDQGEEKSDIAPALELLSFSAKRESILETKTPSQQQGITATSSKMTDEQRTRMQREEIIRSRVEKNTRWHGMVWCGLCHEKLFVWSSVSC